MPLCSKRLAALLQDIVWVTGLHNETSRVDNPTLRKTRSWMANERMRLNFCTIPYMGSLCFLQQSFVRL